MAAKKEKKSRTGVKTLEAFHEKYGAARVNVRERSKNLGTWATGSLKLDDILGGGVPKGNIVEIYGPPGSGKSTLAVRMASLVLREGKPVIYFDLERGLDLRNADAADDGTLEISVPQDETDEERTERVASRDSWLRTNGIEPLDENFSVYEPYTGEELFEMLGSIVENELAALCVVDSVPAIMPGKVMDSNPGDATYGSRAKLLAEELPRLLRLYGDNLETTIVFINQVRENIGAQVKSHKATGGFALEHYIRCKIKTQRVRRIEQGDDVITESRVKVEKNIYGSNSETTVRISSLRGIDIMSELLEVGLDFQYIQLSGNWHYFFAEPVDPEVFAKAQKKKTIASLDGYLAGMNGEAAALKWMQENGWEEKLLPIARKALKP